MSCYPEMTHKPAGKSYWRVQVSDQHKELLSELPRRAASQPFRAQSDTRGSSVQEADEGMVIFSSKSCVK